MPDSNIEEMSLAQAKALTTPAHRVGSAKTVVPTVFRGQDLLDLQIAVRHRCTAVVLSSGRKFTLHYEALNNIQRVYFKVERGLSPSGWLDIEHLLRERDGI